MNQPPAAMTGKPLNVLTSGRLGNLLFQYSLVLYAEKIGVPSLLNAKSSAPSHIAALEALIDIPEQSIVRTQLPRALQDVDALTRAHDVVHRAWLKLLWQLEMKGIRANRSADFTDSSELRDLPFSTRASGYFQRDDLVNEVFDQLTAQIRPRVLERLSSHRDETVIHLRLGDYVALPDLGVLTPEYYKSALVKAGGTTKDPVCVVTDSPATVEATLCGLNVVEVVSGSWLDDFTRIAAANRRIIANSSFSWWAARLGEAPNKLTAGPWPWFAKTPSPALRRSEWVWVDSAFSVQ